jgi:hypothetical protein
MPENQVENSKVNRITPSLASNEMGTAQPEHAGSGLFEGLSGDLGRLVMPVVFPIRRNRLVTDRYLTDQQMRLYMKFGQTHSMAVAATKASISTATAYPIEQDRRLPLQKNGSTRPPWCRPAC